ncbi:helicase RecD/TraA (plasmid) [Fischerella sp. NIES-4106]|nr:helicase RecD/TraA [Fischerella sp. NIES-4106]
MLLNLCSYLDDVVQIGDCAVALDFDSTPNHGTDAQDKNMKLVNNKLLRIDHWVILPHCQSHLPRKKSLSFITNIDTEEQEVSVQYSDRTVVYDYADLNEIGIVQKRGFIV